MTNTPEAEGEKLLSVVERLVEDTDDLVARVALLKQAAGFESGVDDPRKRALVAKKIINTYSHKSALSGAVTALPAVFPGVGTMVAAVGGAFVDVGLMLKFEVEMVLCLDYLHGYNVKEPEERRLAFLLASVGAQATKEGRNFFLDMAEAEIEAMWNYTPRQVTKLLISIMTKLALRGVTRETIARFIPLLGVAVCGTMNKVFTSEVGHWADAVLSQRAVLESQKNAIDKAVDAIVRQPYES